ncbi:MAG: peptidylprolyl isomerase, partial [Acidimicrobiales bacterium]
RVQLLAQVETLFPSAADPAAEAERLYDEVPYLPFLAEYQAGQNALSAVLAESAEPGEGNPCVRHILVETEAEGDDLVEQLDGGADFGELAVEFSTGPSGPNGGGLGCAPSANYVPEFAAAVDEAELGVVVGPVETQFGWHVIIVDRYEIDGRTIAGDLLRARLQSASVEIDENLGTWDPERLLVVPFGA